MCTLPHYICTIGSKCLHIHFKLSKSTELILCYSDDFMAFILFFEGKK